MQAYNKKKRLQTKKKLPASINQLNTKFALKAAVRITDRVGIRSAKTYA